MYRIPSINPQSLVTKSTFSNAMITSIGRNREAVALKAQNNRGRGVVKHRGSSNRAGGDPKHVISLS